MKYLLALLLLASFSVCAKQNPPLPIEQCADEAPFGVPSSRKQDTRTICRIGYVLEHDNKAKIPIWVSYTLKPTEATGCNARDSAFAVDQSLPINKRATPKDYAKSGYDTGHLANDGDFRWDLEASRESFILSNMTPQLPGFNRGIWKKLEDNTRGWAISRNHELLIYTGPIYDRGSSTIGSGVIVPTAFYKIIVDLETNEVMAFIFKHEPSQEGLHKFMTSVAEVQRQTGLIFKLPKKPIYSSKLWTLKIKSATSTKKSVCSLR